MPDNDDIDVDELLSEIDQGEEELLELLEAPEENAEEIETEVRALANVAKKTLRSYDTLRTRVERLTERMEKRTERHESRREAAMDELGLDGSDDG